MTPRNTLTNIHCWMPGLKWFSAEVGQSHQFLPLSNECVTLDASSLVTTPNRGAEYRHYFSDIPECSWWHRPLVITNTRQLNKYLIHECASSPCLAKNYSDSKEFIGMGQWLITKRFRSMSLALWNNWEGGQRLTKRCIRVTGTCQRWLKKTFPEDCFREGIICPLKGQYPGAKSQFPTLVMALSCAGECQLSEGRAVSFHNVLDLGLRGTSEILKSIWGNWGPDKEGHTEK